MTNISKERLDELEQSIDGYIRDGNCYIRVWWEDAKAFISAARRLAEVEAELTDMSQVAAQFKAERNELRVLDEENTAKITELVRSGVEEKAKLSNIRWTLGVDEVDERPTVYFVEQLKAERDALKAAPAKSLSAVCNEVLDTAITRIKSATTGMHEQDRIGKALEILQAMKEVDND